MSLRPFAALAAGSLFLSSCVGPPEGRERPEPVRATPAPSTPAAQPPRLTAPPSTVIKTDGSARLAGAKAGPKFVDLGLTRANAAAALAAFKLSCPVLIRRNDASGLTRGADWQASCDAASAWTGDPIDFFARNFEAVTVGDGQAFATGYYEPEIAGSRTKRAGYSVPIYAKPRDIIEADLSLWNDDLKARKIRGRVQGNMLVPYYDRSEIVGGALAGRGLEIAWAADEVEFFFLQVQGSGRLRLPDGGVMRIGYDGQNGRDYTGIGKWLRDAGRLQPGEASMQGIMAYLRRQPDRGASVMNQNRSFVFFRELTGPGPLGAINVPVTGRSTVAADPAFVPLGAPVILQMDRAEASGIWVAQDTGGAIKGANRFDTFWGAGEDARTIAGGMSARGTATLLLPKGSLTRLR